LKRRDALTIILAQRLWQAGSGLVTIVLVTHFLSPEQQGWYYCLVTLAALYTLFDLGLSYVLVQAAAHSFVGLQWEMGGKVEGSHAKRFESLAAWSARHYCWLAIGYALIVIPAGFLFFGTTPSASVSWRFPWLLLGMGSAGALVLLPFLALIEGTGQVAEVYAVRLFQGVAAAVACWIALAAGLGLFAVVMAPLFAIAIQGIWLTSRKAALLSSAYHGSHLRSEWSREIWQHQWQIGLGSLCGYLLTQVYTPVLFKVQDAVVAGQMGLTLTAANMLGLIAQSWITRHVPAMATAVATRNWHEFDRIFYWDFCLSCAVFVAGGATLCLLHWMLSGTAYAERLLPFWPFAGMLAVGLLGHIQSSLAAQLRSFRREPLMWVTVVGTLLTAAGALWGAVHYSASGVVVAMLTIQAVVVLPISVLIWRKCRRNWRLPVERDPAPPDNRNPDLEPGAIPRLGP
jgi:hypothetical protein